MIEFMIAGMAEYTREVRPTIWRRYLALMLDALRPPGDEAKPLPEPELSVDEMVKVLQANPLGRRPARKPER
jgi:hypothetical protein